MTRRQFFERLLPSGLIELRAIDLKVGMAGRKFTTDIDEIDAFCVEHAGREVYFGVAPRLKKHGGPRNHAPTHVLWVDIDFKETDEADARERLLLMDHGPHVVVNSGGGLHCYWVMESPPADPKAELRRLAAEVGGDARSAEPAHILRVPDTLNHKYAPPRRVYIEDARAGAWPHGNSAPTPSPAVATEYHGPTGSAAALSKARAFMADRAPAIEGSGGDRWTFETACSLVRDHGLSESDSLELMLSWNTRCEPPWTTDELTAKLRGAIRYGTGEIGSEDPARDFGALGNGHEPIAEKPESLMGKMCHWFKAVDEDGELRVYARRHDETLERNYWVRYTRRNFLEVTKSIMHLPMMECGTKTNGDPRFEEPAVHWLDHHFKKKTYRGLVFAPEHADDRTPGGKLNLWQGFAVEPAAGSWEYMKELTYDTLCDSDLESYSYVMDWMARAVQVPWEPGGTAIVFKGMKGTGKGTLARAFCRLFGQHGLHITSQTLLVGRFNSHLRDVCALFADEAFWAGDKAGESVLKGLITEPTLAYEGKGKDVTTGRNCIHLVQSSNEDWVVPAGMEGERRFAVFNVAPDVHDNSYWAALRAEMDNGGLAAMLHELLARDISSFNVFRTPHTLALAEQKMRSMGVIPAWLYEQAQLGWGDFGPPVNGMYATEEVKASYLRHCDRHNARGQRSSEVVLGMTLKKLLPIARSRVLLPGAARQKYFYIMPEPSEAVRLIEKKLGLPNEIGE